MNHWSSPEYKQIDLCPWPLGFDTKYLKQLPDANKIKTPFYSLCEIIDIVDQWWYYDEGVPQFSPYRRVNFKKETLMYHYPETNTIYYCDVWVKYE